MLIGQFWGTGDAAGVPAPFCRCAVCSEAREKGGRFMRMRSSFRLTDRVMLDLGADAVQQSARFGDIADVEHVLISHTHDDHLNPHMLMETMWAGNRGGTLHYYFTDKAYEIVEHWRASPWILKGWVSDWEQQGLIAFHRLEFGKRYEIGGIGVIPLRGNHVGNVGENAALYLIFLPDGRTLFYGLDSGVYFPETLEALKAHRVDLMISECTVGDDAVCPSPAHMSMRDVHTLVQTLCAQGTLHEGSRLWFSHMSHKNGASYTAICARAEAMRFPIPATVAYDGLKIL